MRRGLAIAVLLCLAPAAWARGPERAREAVKRVIASGERSGVVGRVAVVEREAAHGRRSFTTTDARKGEAGGRATFVLEPDGRLVKTETVTRDGRGGWRQSFPRRLTATVKRTVDNTHVLTSVRQGRDARGRFTEARVEHVTILELVPPLVAR